MDDFIGGVLGMSLIFGSIAAWLTHVITCLTAGLWGFLIAGVIFFPIGIIHGVIIWFGGGV